MSSSMLSYLRSLWPFRKLENDDLKVSSRLVQKLSVPDRTKEFIFAIHEPETNAVVYLLAAQNLSKQSALDAESLIKEVRPSLVIAQVASSVSADILAEEKCLSNDGTKTVPNSSIGVLRSCFIEKTKKDQYESYAGCQVLKEIFGTGFYGHFLAAKRASEEIGSHFLIVESPYEKRNSATSACDDDDSDSGSTLDVQKNCLVPQKSTSVLVSSPKRICLTDDLQSQIKLVIPSMDLLMSKASMPNTVVELGQQNCQPVKDYQAPSFAQSIYPLLADLYDIFSDLQSVGKALYSAQRVFSDINDGKPVNSENLCDVYLFRVTVEYLRAALNSAARSPPNQTESSVTTLGFFELSSEEKSHVLFAHTLKSHAKKHGSVVAIVDASCLAGIRKHWKSSVPLEVEKLSDLTFGCFDIDGEEKVGKRKLLADKPVVAVGAGATAVIGASSLSKAVPASTLVKLATFKVPPILKLGITQLKRTAAIGFSKILGPSNFFTQAVASAGAKTSTVKVAASAEKIRAVTHTIIASAERTSLLAMRTSFYEVMRRLHVRPVGLAPLATFSCSMAACAGLLFYGDGIECVAESMPHIPTVASLGRGLESLNRASNEARQTNCTKIQETLHMLMSKLPKTRTD